MPEPVLAARSALATVAMVGHHGAGGSPGVTLTELRGLKLASLTARTAKTDDLAAGIERAFGVVLPARPGYAAKDSAAFVWSARNRWLVVGEASDDVLRRLNSCVGELGYVTDLTGSRTILRVSGSRARDGLMKLLPIYLDEEAFGIGAAASTVAARMPVQVWSGQAGVYDIAVPRSYGFGLWRALLAACAEFGCQVDGDSRGSPSE